ncbi:hypothetical protein [Mobilicoccus pelagius]|uniref:Uncharacterized protein n=1 Tax=Mobilicoccus pelagius NBRC 104925 TaxID=1089455 RepID=H5UNK0_9MICO|nr:hypothetical protein [Mobilicoccus pelagius]GAB47308.1 hypothetical protein MOPEL_007_01240 [Mobilicoccus pelagius NBRC 104925]
MHDSDSAWKEVILRILLEEAFQLPGTLESPSPDVIPYQVAEVDGTPPRMVDIAFRVVSPDGTVLGTWAKKMEVPPSLTRPNSAAARYLKLAFCAGIMEWWETTDRGDDPLCGIESIDSPYNPALHR